MRDGYGCAIGAYDGYGSVLECKKDESICSDLYEDKKSLYLVVQGYFEEQEPLQLFLTFEDAKKEIEKMLEEEKIQYGQEICCYTIVEFVNNMAVKTFHQYTDGHFE